MSDSAVVTRAERTDQNVDQVIGRLANQIWDQTNGPALLAYRSVLKLQLRHARTVAECHRLILDLEDFYREALVVGRNQGVNLGFVLGKLAERDQGTENADLSAEQIMRLMGEEPLSPSNRRILAGVEELVIEDLTRVA